MMDFLLELRCEEIPARMQAKASADLARLFTDALASAGLNAQRLTSFVTPRRLALIAHDLPLATQAVSEEYKGPRTSAPDQALDGFLRKTGLTRDQLEDRDGVWFATVEKPGRATAAVLAEIVPAIIRAFPWPKSMRWGQASRTTESLRWVRPLQGIVALLGDEVVPVEIDGIESGRETMGHRFHSSGAVVIESAATYADQLRAAHVIVDQDERGRIIAERASALATEAGLELVEDAGLVAENAGLTEWPVPLLGRFDPAFLEVPPEVIQLTLRINQKYFVLRNPPRNGEGDQPQAGGGGAPLGGSLANAFICTANIEATDGGAAIVAGNGKVLAARLSDARFFWEQDKKTPLEVHAEKLSRITFHEKLGTVADKVERVAKLARWLCEEGIVKPAPVRPEPVEGMSLSLVAKDGASTSSARTDLERLATLAEQAARLCKADLVTEMVGEFPELQGLMGGYYARAQGLPDEVADAIRDHYKPVGQGDEVPTAPVTVAVSLADKLDSLTCFFRIHEIPTGSRDPFAIRRAAISILRLVLGNGLRLPLRFAFETAGAIISEHIAQQVKSGIYELPNLDYEGVTRKTGFSVRTIFDLHDVFMIERYEGLIDFPVDLVRSAIHWNGPTEGLQAVGTWTDFVRIGKLLEALQSFIETDEGANLLAGYKRAANILKKGGFEPSGAPAQAAALADEAPGLPALRPSPEHGSAEGEGIADAEAKSAAGEEDPLANVDDPDLMDAMMARRDLVQPPALEPAEAALIAALDAAEPAAQAAIEREDFTAAMAALAGLRAPIDAFFEQVTVNDADPARRQSRLSLLTRIRAAVHRVADFSKIEG